MLPLDQPIYVRVPTQNNQRKLILGRVVEHDEEQRHVLDMTQPIACEPGSELLVYHMPNREFMQQPARIESAWTVDADDADASANNPSASNKAAAARQRLALFVTGEAVSAESRSCYRASTVIGGRHVYVDNMGEVPMLDVSQSGLAILGKPGLSIGQALTVKVEGQSGRTFAGHAVVQSIFETELNRTRYGLLAVESRGQRNLLVQGLQWLTMQVQREQLKRQAGAA